MGRDADIGANVLTLVGFNPRARMGRDISYIRIVSCLVSFNPRARMGRDTSENKLTTALDSFNPRARMGRDFMGMANVNNVKVSIHAPAWGATIALLIF